MSDTPRFLRGVEDGLRDAGLHAALVVRDLNTGRELAINADETFAIASVGKIPLAIAVAERFADGSLDPGRRIEVQPGLIDEPGPTGISRFRHPVSIALEDLLMLAITVSDNSAADALLEIVPLDAIEASLKRLGLHGIQMRHGFRELADTPLDGTDSVRNHLAHVLAVAGRTDAGGHPVRQLDQTRSNTATARALAHMLGELWHPRRLDAAAAARVRELLAGNVIRHRLAPEFASDATRWSSKTGTLLNLRHEIGVVDHDDGSAYAVVALSASSVAARTQTAAEIALAGAARELYERLRSD